eukprot:scaffold2220_cov377-Prasinococcus_capsulatus_cf.AAC.3
MFPPKQQSMTRNSPHPESAPVPWAGFVVSVEILPLSALLPFARASLARKPTASLSAADTGSSSVFCLRRQQLHQLANLNINQS